MKELQILVQYYQFKLDQGTKFELLADICIDQAFIQAQKCDQVLNELRQDNPEKLDELGLLYGIPISFKDNIILKNTEQTLGCQIHCQQPAENDGLIATLIKNQGGIPFIKSNVPQGLRMNETMNHIFGRSQNPWNSLRTTGGSSGGEGGLLCSSCSPLGIGTDIGGSLRIPALYCGVYSLKPTVKRVSWEGVMSAILGVEYDLGQINILPVVGPMGKCVEDVARMFKCLIAKEVQQIDPFIPYLPFNNDDYNSKRKLTVGFILSSSFFPASIANQNAVIIAAKELEKKGHKIIQLDFPYFKELVFTFLKVLSAKGKFREVKDIIQDEPIMEEFSLIKKLSELPDCLKSIIGKILKCKGEKRKAEIVLSNLSKSVSQYFEISSNQQYYQNQFFQFWKDNNLDAIISPGLAIPAIPHGYSKQLFLSACYTFVWNTLNYPTGVVPIKLVEENEQVYLDGINDSFTKDCQMAMDNSCGLPVGVQISTLPFKEELCLGIMKQIEDAVKFNKEPII